MIKLTRTLVAAAAAVAAISVAYAQDAKGPAKGAPTAATAAPIYPQSHYDVLLKERLAMGQPDTPQLREAIRDELTTRELSVLEALMSRIGWVVSKEQMLERLYSYSEEASGNAIEVYIHRLRKKIESAGVTIKTIRGLGYIIEKSS